MLVSEVFVICQLQPRLSIPWEKYECFVMSKIGFYMSNLFWFEWFDSKIYITDNTILEVLWRKVERSGVWSTLDRWGRNVQFKPTQFPNPKPPIIKPLICQTTISQQRIIAQTSLFVNYQTTDISYQKCLKMTAKSYKTIDICLIIVQYIFNIQEKIVWCFVLVIQGFDLYLLNTPPNFQGFFGGPRNVLYMHYWYSRDMH